VKQPWAQNAAPSSSTLQSVIGRAHLDRAHAEGRAAGSDPEKTAADCPYGSQANLMTIKAWEAGFRAARPSDAEPPARNA